MAIAFKIKLILIEISNLGKLSDHNKKYLDGYINFLMKNEKITLNNNNELILYVTNFDIKYMVNENKPVYGNMRPILNVYFKNKSNFYYKLINKNIFNIK